MNQAGKKSFMKYTSSVYIGIILIGAFFLFTGLSYVLQESDIAIIIISLLIAAAGVGIIFSQIRNAKKIRNFVADKEQSGQLPLLLNDFAGSQSLVGDKVRVGREYIFGKKQGVPIAYSQMRQVYQYIKKKNFVENQRELRCVLENGKTVTLCQLKLRGKSDEDVSKIMAFIHYKNPGVHLGYK